jgi:hypothetical protein
MLSLREVQIAFCAAIRSEDAGALVPWVLDAGIPPERRIQIYRNNYRIAALAVMQTTYPVVERLSGADWFEQSVAKFQQMHPSQSGDLQHLGANYPEFLQGELADTDYAYFSDVAALEWCYQRVLTAQERRPVDVALLHAVAPEDYEGLKFVPRPALGLVESAFPIFAIWQANQPDVQTEAAIRLDAGRSRVLLIRREDHVELRELKAGSFELLRQFQLGTPLGAAATAAAALSPEFDLTACLRELLGLEAIADITAHVPMETHEIAGGNRDG